MVVQVIGVSKRISWRPPPLNGAGPHAKLSVIIPARDEEADIAQSLGSVLNQVGVDLEVIVVNDHSSDRTGRIADTLAASDARLKVIHDPELPPGWLGKCNAMQQAAAAFQEISFFLVTLIFCTRRHASRRPCSRWSGAGWIFSAYSLSCTASRFGRM